MPCMHKALNLIPSATLNHKNHWVWLHWSPIIAEVLEFLGLNTESPKISHLLCHTLLWRLCNALICVIGRRQRTLMLKCQLACVRLNLMMGTVPSLNMTPSLCHCHSWQVSKPRVWSHLQKDRKEKDWTRRISLALKTFRVTLTVWHHGPAQLPSLASSSEPLAWLVENHFVALGSPEHHLWLGQNNNEKDTGIYKVWNPEHRPPRDGLRNVLLLEMHYGNYLNAESSEPKIYVANESSAKDSYGIYVVFVLLPHVCKKAFPSGCI